MTRSTGGPDTRLAVHPAVDDDLPTVGDDRRALLAFDDAAPVVIICPEAPEDAQSPLADEHNANFTRLHKFADADALIEIFGHIRALNPDTPVAYRLPSDVNKNELQNHLVILGGVGWNRLARRLQSEFDRLPVEQVEDERLPNGEMFRLRKTETDNEVTFFPITEDIDGVDELIEDIALLVRLRNPFNSSRTLTICNGVFSAGVVGAVLAIADETVRPTNERYLASRFPVGEFAMLIKVPVVSGAALAPDLQNPQTRVFEWQPEP